MNKSTQSVLAALVFFSACVKSTAQVKTLSQSGHLRTAHLTNMRAIVTGDEAKAVLQKNEAATKLAQNMVRSQFRFLTGAIGNGEGRGVHFNLPPNNVVVEAIPQGALIRYDLNFEMNLPQHSAEAFTMDAYFPIQPDAAGLSAFYKKYGAACGRIGALDSAPSENAVQLFYFFSPERAGCAAKNDAENPQSIVFKNKISIEKSENKKPSRKAPDYNSIWKDGVLKAAILVAPTGVEDDEPELPGTLAKQDSGIASFNMLYWKLKNRFPTAKISVLGKPSALGARETPGEQNWYVRFEGVAQDDNFDIHLMLAPKVYLEDIDSKHPIHEIFNSATKGADFVAYAGHAGFGKNMDVLNSWGGFEPGQSFLFYINSCWSVGYFLDPNSARAGENLLARIEALNKGAPWAKNVDFILNETSSNMYKNASNVIAILDALQYADRTYVEILNGLAQDAQPVVFGEEDNADLPE